MIRDAHWDEIEREEFDAARRDAWAWSERQGERNTRFVELLLDGEQAHRRWAVAALAEAQRVGAASQLKSWHKQQRTVAVSHDGAIITKSRTIGIKRADGDGDSYDTQMLFDFTTWEELDAKRASLLQVVRSYNDTIAMIDRLLALHLLAPDALTPADAASTLGTTLDEWLGVEAA